jgi:hypothetical protein
MTDTYMMKRVLLLNQIRCKQNEYLFEMILKNYSKFTMYKETNIDGFWNFNSVLDFDEDTFDEDENNDKWYEFYR